MLFGENEFILQLDEINCLILSFMYVSTPLIQDVKTYTKCYLSHSFLIHIKIKIIFLAELE